jgi:phosphoglycolate phosphatase-like HAD superfamily hydrolase
VPSVAGRSGQHRKQRSPDRRAAAVDARCDLPCIRVKLQSVPHAPLVVAFDLGHTIMDERRDADVPIETRPIHLMPGVADVLPHLPLPLALWANTRVARDVEVRRWLERAGLAGFFESVITSVDAGARKPSREFFEYALARGGWEKSDVVFVGNQLNSDITGAEAFGIRSIWLSAVVYRSHDDLPCQARPTFTIETLHGLPALLRRLPSGDIDVSGGG